MYSYVDTNFLADLIKSRLVPTNIVKNIVKIATLSTVGREVPLNEKNFTMAESRTKIVEKIIMRINDVLLERFKVGNAAILPLTL